jgi:hypothetical protein
MELTPVEHCSLVELDSAGFSFRAANNAIYILQHVCIDLLLSGLSNKFTFPFFLAGTD